VNTDGQVVVAVAVVPEGRSSRTRSSRVGVVATAPWGDNTCRRPSSRRRRRRGASFPRGRPFRLKRERSAVSGLGTRPANCQQQNCGPLPGGRARGRLSQRRRPARQGLRKRALTGLAGAVGGTSQVGSARRRRARTAEDRPERSAGLSALLPDLLRPRYWEGCRTSRPQPSPDRRRCRRG